MSSSDIYETLGIRPIINAGGHMTILGGSVLSPEVREAMESANTAYTRMDDVFDGVSKAIAGMLGTGGGLVTSGCYAALVQGAAAILAGSDPERIRRLPDTTGMKDEFLIQKPTRYRYDRSVTVPGGKTGGGRRRRQLHAAAVARCHRPADGGHSLLRRRRAFSPIRFRCPRR